MSDSTHLYQSVSLSPSSQSVPLSSAHSLLIFPSCSLPFHNISSSVPSIPLDTQHFLKPFTVTSDEMCCYAVLIHIDWVIHAYFLVHKRTWTNEEDSQFSPWIVLVVLRILNTYVLIFYVVSVVWSVWVHGFFMVFSLWSDPGFIFMLCLWSDQSEFMAIFMVFSLWSGPGFIFESCG